MEQNVVNDLLDYGYKIVQNPSFFKFSLDSILLADFVNINYTDKKLLDLCTGNAPLPIILSKKISSISCVEIQNEVYNLAKESININNIINISLINDDIKNWQNYFSPSTFDIITCNPPYFKYNETSNINDNIIKSIARHEIKITLEEIIEISSKLVKPKGKLNIVYRPDRFIELVNYLKKYNFGIKRIECAYDDFDKNCSIILVEAMKNGKDDLKILPPLLTKNYRGE